jgi:hypothetical protein
LKTFCERLINGLLLCYKNKIILMTKIEGKTDMDALPIILLLIALVALSTPTAARGA